MSNQHKDKRVPFGDIAKGLNQGLDSADPMRYTALQRLARVRAIKESILKREQERLKAKLGPKDPRVAAIGTKLDANRELQRDVELGVSRSSTPAIRPEGNTWVLHGRVRNQARKGLPKLTVGLYDRKNKWIEGLGYACTDKNGYFQLCYTRPKEEPAAAKTAAGPQVRIHILDKQGVHLYVDKRPLALEHGRVDYREIILGNDGESCRPPESQPVPKPGKDEGKEETGRFLGNSSTRELHDLKNIAPRCRIDAIRSDHRVYFATQKKATEAGYDFCTYCLGRENSNH